MRTTSVARWVSEAKTPWAWRFGKRCLPKREFWKSGLPRAQNDTRRRRARSDNPKVMWFKSHLRNQSVCTKKMHRRNPQITQGFLGIFHTRKQDANKKMQMVKIGLGVGFEPMTYSFWGEFQSCFSEIRPFFCPL